MTTSRAGKTSGLPPKRGYYEIMARSLWMLMGERATNISSHL
jgi:hypothetical protein